MPASGEPARSDLAGSRSLPGIQEMTRKRLWIVVAVLLAIVFSVWRWIGHAHTEADDQNRPLATSAETVAAVARAERHNVGNTLTIAGEFKPFQDVNIHAKVAGYIKVIHVDVGDHVKAGQTLAVLEIPELAAQLAGGEAGVRRSKEEIRRAEGDLARAQSAHAASHSAYARLKQAAESRSGLVAQQEIDDSQAKDLEFEAQVSSSSAALSAAQQQLQVAEANQKQYSAQSVPVVRLAQISKLRLVLPIPESVAAQIHLGDPVKVRVQALNQDIVGKVSRFADSLDRQTRTMETEIDFENGDGHLIPGMYAESQLSLREKKDALTVPLESVTRDGEDATVLAVNTQNIIEERHVKLGLEDSVRVEVLSGLTDKDRVVIGNRSQFRNGQKIRPKEIGAGPSKAAGEN